MRSPRAMENARIRARAYRAAHREDVDLFHAAERYLNNHNVKEEAKAEMLIDLANRPNLLDI